MAYELKQRGYTDVTILERSNRVGGKAETFFYRNTEHALAVIYWTREYNNTLVPLLEKYGLKGDTVTVQDQFAFWPRNTPTVPAIDLLANPLPADQFAALLQALNAYIDIHHDLFGIYDYDYGVSKCCLLLNWSY